MNGTCPPSRLAGRRGLALVFVLWGVALLALMTAGFLDESRTEMRAVLNRVAAAEAEALADGAIHRAIWELLAARHADRPGPPRDGTPIRGTIEGATLTLRIRDEAGKIDLNGADAARLTGLLRALGVEPGRAATLTARILDFADKDDLPRPGGAEMRDYAAAGLDHGPANRRFLDPGELEQIPGLGKGLAERMRDHVTVGVFTRGVDPAAATRPALLAQPGATAEAVDRYLAGRGSGARPPDGPAWATSPRTRFTIRATVRRADAAFAREALVTLDPRARPPFRIRAWRQVAVWPADAF